ncbi:MAG: energy transducer TonB [Pasteurellaceae bacterium]|nr:energy transducer TonB [Pasteurellaceae bacterium]
MIITPPSFWHGRESLKWLAAMIVAFLGHWGFVLAFGDKQNPAPEPMAMPAVMLEFADFPQSATQVESFSIGVPQQITQNSIATPAEMLPTNMPKVSVEDTPEIAHAEIVVEKKPETPTKKRPQHTHPPKQGGEKKTKSAKKRQAKPNDVDSQSSAQANSAPPKGEDSSTAAPIDSNGSNQQLAQNWQSRVLGKLRRHQSYPAFALENRVEGTVAITIHINAQGKLFSANIRKSSGHHILDSEAIKIAHRASPLPPPPAHLLKQGELHFTVPIRFNIKEYRKQHR